MYKTRVVSSNDHKKFNSKMHSTRVPFVQVVFVTSQEGKPSVSQTRHLPAQGVLAVRAAIEAQANRQANR